MEKQHIGTFSFSREWQRIRKETAEQAAHTGKFIEKHSEVGQSRTARHRSVVPLHWLRTGSANYR